LNLLLYLNWFVCQLFYFSVNADVHLRCVQAVLSLEGHMDDGLTLQLCQHEESRAARIIRNTTHLFTQFIRYKILTLRAQMLKEYNGKVPPLITECDVP